MQQILLTISIPTYNRASFLETLLGEIVKQAKEFPPGILEVCISNNHSTDNTKDVIESFQALNPGLIRLNTNPENVGLDANIVKVLEMASGKFIWTMGDDDTIVASGIKNVMEMLQAHTNENTGFLMLGHQAYFIEEGTGLPAQAGKKVIYYNGVVEAQPKTYAISQDTILGMRMDSCFLSVMVFNNQSLKKILQQEPALIKKAMGRHYIHAFLYQLMFFANPKLQAIKYNQIIVEADLHYYKFYIEDTFQLYYADRLALSDLLLSFSGINKEQAATVGKERAKLTRGFIRDMATTKAFGAINYNSFLGCLGLFFKQAPLPSAFLFSVWLAMLSLLPSSLVRQAYKAAIKIKYKKGWEAVWLPVVTINSKMSQGTRRVII